MTKLVMHPDINEDLIRVEKAIEDFISERIEMDGRSSGLIMGALVSVVGRQVARQVFHGDTTGPMGVGLNKLSMLLKCTALEEWLKLDHKGHYWHRHSRDG